MRVFIHATVLALCAALALGVFTGCTSDTASTSTADGLYMTDTYSGKVYVYGTTDHAAGSTSIVSTGQNSTGAISFYKGVGYVAVASYNNTDPGVYWFNPEDEAPAAVRIGSADVSAQYMAFSSATKAYVTVADYYGASDAQGVYTFNPSDLDAGLSGPISGTNASGMYLQQIVVGPDSKVYVADYNNQKVYVIDPSTDALSSTTYAASAGGTTALAAGYWNGTAGVFVGNIPYSGTGSVDFIDATAGTVSAVLPSTAASRLLYVSSAKKLVTTSYTHSYIVDVSSAAASAAELGGSLGGADLAARDGLVYVGYTDYTASTLSVFDVSGTAESYSPVSVMGTGECLAGLAFYAD